jgi:hypothetical protein
MIGIQPRHSFALSLADCAAHHTNIILIGPRQLQYRSTYTAFELDRRCAAVVARTTSSETYRRPRSETLYVLECGFVYRAERDTSQTMMLPTCGSW